MRQVSSNVVGAFLHQITAFWGCTAVCGRVADGRFVFLNPDPLGSDSSELIPYYLLGSLYLLVLSWATTKENSECSFICFEHVGTHVQHVILPRVIFV